MNKELKKTVEDMISCLVLENLHIPSFTKRKLVELEKIYSAQKLVNVDQRVSPKSTDIEKQEQIVTILYEFIDNMIIDNAYKDYQKGYSTHGIREAVGTALQKILKLDNLEVMEVQ